MIVNPSNGCIYAMAALAMEPYDKVFETLGRRKSSLISTHGMNPPAEGYVETDPFLVANPLPAYTRVGDDMPEETKTLREYNVRTNQPLTVFINMALPKYDYSIAKYTDGLRKIGAKVGATTISQLANGNYPGKPRDSIIEGIAQLAGVKAEVVFGSVNRHTPFRMELDGFPRDFNKLTRENQEHVLRLVDELMLAQSNAGIAR